MAAYLFLETKLLYFIELKGVTAEEITAEDLVVIQTFEAKNSKNFGGLSRLGRINAYKNTKNALQRDVIGLGFPALISQNSFGYDSS